IGPGTTLHPISSALPLVYFARTVTAVADEAAVGERLLDLDPAAETLIAGGLPPVSYEPSASATVTRRGDDALTVHYRARGQIVALGVSSFDPGWDASRDGAELPTRRVDHAFIGVLVPPGEGDIQLSYAPRFFWWAVGISALAWLFVVPALMGHDRRHPR